MENIMAIMGNMESREIRMNKAGKLVRAAVGMQSAAMLLLLTGCAASGLDENVRTGEAGGTIGQSAAENTAQTAETSVVGMEESSFAAELEEGEQALGAEPSQYSFQGEIPVFAVDWEAVKQDAPEVTGYLVIPGCGIQTPITVRAEDQTYYDTHNADGSDSSYGTVHMDIGNTPDYSDPNTVLYGSDAEGGPLESLSEYGDPSFFEQNPYLYIFTPSQTYEYHVFAAYTSNETNILMTYNCYDYDIFSQYINQIYDTRSMDANLNSYIKDAVISGWRMLTISAGEGKSTDRYLIQATFSASSTQQNTEESN